MGSWPDVNPGQAFEPSAQLENDVRHLVNRRGLAGVRANGGGMQVENICINAYNPGSTAIAAGAVVTFLDAAMVEGAVQVAAMASGSTDTEWGIVQEQIESHQFGSVLVMGAFIVPISGSSGSYAVPSGGGASFVRADSGIARILRLIGSSSALILVGSSSGGGEVYTQGVGVQISGGTPGVPSVISSVINGGTDIEVSGGSDGNPYTISYTGGGGGGGSEFYVPNYSDLTVGGLPLNSFGRAITFFVPVKAGNINYWDEGSGAVGVYIDITGTTVCELTNKVNYPAPADGWMRISVYDDGSSPGECLSFTSPTGGLPLYKYSYNVSGVTASVTGGTACVSLIGGNTNSTLLIAGSGAVSISDNSGVITISANTGATGISAAVNGSTATISLNGGTGSVVLMGDGETIDIEEGEDGEIVLSVIGSGDDRTPYWGNYRNYYDTNHNQTVVELYSENLPGIGSGASGYIPTNGSFSPAFTSYVYVFAVIEAQDTSAIAEVHVTVNYASMKVCAVKGSGVSIGNGLTIKVRAGQSINISKTNVKSGCLIGMVCYEMGLDDRFAPEP